MLVFGFGVNKRLLCHTAHEKAWPLSPLKGTPPHLTRDTSKTSLRKDPSLSGQSLFGAKSDTKCNSIDSGGQKLSGAQRELTCAIPCAASLDILPRLLSKSWTYPLRC